MDIFICFVTIIQGNYTGELYMVIIQILISKCPVKEEFDPLDHNLEEIKSLDGQVKHVKYVKKASGQAGEFSDIERH